MNLMYGCSVMQGRAVSQYDLSTDCQKLENGQLVKISRHKCSKIMFSENSNVEGVITLKQLCEIVEDENYRCEKPINELRKKTILLQRIVTFYKELLHYY